MNPWRNWSAQRKAARAFRARQRYYAWRIETYAHRVPAELIDILIADLERRLQDTPSSTE